MKKQTLNTSATKNTLADMAVSMLASGDTITPAPIVPEVPEIDVAKIYTKLKEKERVENTLEAKSNAQPKQGEKKTRATRAKLSNNVNVEQIGTMPVSREDGALTVDQLLQRIKDTHEKLQSGQTNRISDMAQIGRDFVTVKKELLSLNQLEEKDEKKISRILGTKYKEAGIGTEVIDRQIRDKYIWLGENETEANDFIETARNTEKEKRTKAQKNLVNAYNRQAMTPYVIYSAMTPKEDPKEKTSADTAKAHINQVIKEMTKKKGKAQLDLSAIDAIDKIREQAIAILDNALAEMEI